VLLARNLQTSHQDLAANVTGSVTDLVDVSTIDRFQTLGTTVLSMIDAEINRQAAMIAYIDDFRAMMWMTFAAVPLVLLMRKADLTKPKPWKTCRTEAMRRGLAVSTRGATCRPRHS
jgi:DHA2 family multidrug resistance protein